MTALDSNLSLLLFIIGGGSVVSAFDCYSCTYTLTGDPSYNFECADEPEEFKVGQTTIPCPDTNFCTIKVVFNADKTEIRSINRGCQVPQPFQCGENCCDKSIYDVSCQYQCQSDVCNGRDLTKDLKRGSAGDASHLYPIFSLQFISILPYLVQYFLT